MNKYLLVSPDAISAALVREAKDAQKPVYYTSRVFSAVVVRYPRLDFLAFALVITARRLRSYFQAYPIKVFIQATLKKMQKRLDASAHLLNLAIELSEFDIKYLPQNVVRGKSLLTL